MKASIAFFVFCLFLVLGCVSRSVPNQRFIESHPLLIPALKTNISDPNHFTFAIVGDLHVGGTDTTRFRTILNAAAAEGDAFIVLLGDLVDKGEKASVEAVQTAISDLNWTGKVLSVIGNHDIFGDGWIYYKQFLGPTHYSVTIGNSKFIALDTADGVVGKDQTDWMISELEKPRPMHTFILSHYLPMVPGQRTYLRLADETEAMRLMKYATNHGVRGWFGGHYHSYGVQDIEGVTYVVAGGGGGRRMEPIKEFFYVQVQVSGENVAFERHHVD